MNIKRTIVSAASAVVVLLGATACTHNGASKAVALDQKTSASILAKFENNQPAPQFDFSQIRQTLIDIETAQAQTTQTTSFFYNQGVQDPIFVCPSIGFPIASTTQLTNPTQLARVTQQGYGISGSIGQIDPNGVYSGDSTGTYVVCVNAQGLLYAKYWEGFVDATTGPAVWDEATHREVLVGPPSFKFATKATAPKAPASAAPASPSK